MKVTIHEFSGTESKRPLLEELFRKYLYPGVEVTSEEFPWKHGQLQNGWRYVKLLQAATPPEQGIQIGLDDPFGGYSPYIYAYFALTGHRVSFSRHLLSDNFFPAVSVQDRMVIVPPGLRQRLADSNRGLPPFPAFKSGGVAELDFNDENALRNAVKMVSARVNADFFKDLQAYARFQDLNSVPLQELADDLNTDLAYVQHALRGDKYLFDRASYKHFEWSLTPKELAVNRWTQATLTLKNNSDQALDHLSVQLRGPVKVSPERIEMTVAARSSAQTLVAVKPEESGDYPLEIVGVLPQDKPLAALVNARPIWVKFV